MSDCKYSTLNDYGFDSRIEKKDAEDKKDVIKAKWNYMSKANLEVLFYNFKRGH